MEQVKTQIVTGNETNYLGKQRETSNFKKIYVKNLTSQAKFRKTKNVEYNL